MPRALPAQLETALDSGGFVPYFAIGRRNYTGSPPASLSSYTTLITQILYYKYDGLELTVKYHSENLPADDGLIVGNKYYLERGVIVAGTPYTIKSASLRFDDYIIHKQIVTAFFSLFSADEKPEAIAGDDTYTNVLTALNPNAYWLGTVAFKSTPENSAHWGYNFFPAGKQVVLKSYQSLLPLIRQKYLIQATDNSDDDNEDEIEFFHMRSPLSQTYWGERLTTANGYSAIAYSPELDLYVALGVDSGNAPKITTSVDGVTWTAETNPSLDFQPRSACWSPELALFVVVGVNSSTGKFAATSPDGVTWTGRTCTGPYRGVCWSSELSLFVAVGESAIISTSPDGVTWTNRTSPAAMVHNSVIWVSELSLFIAVSQGGASGRAATSPNGITWTARNLDTTKTWYGLCWSSDLSLLVAVGTNAFATSPDGITWTNRTSPANKEWLAVTWSSFNSIFLAVGYDTAARLVSSPDGITWSTYTGPDDTHLWNIYWSDDDKSYITLSANTASTANKISSSVASLPPNHTIEQGDIKLFKDGAVLAFLWRDEAGTIHTDGANTSLVHNLGYLESTDSPPASYQNSDRASVTVGIHLKYRTGDIFTLQINDEQTATYLGHVTEILDPTATIGWRCEIELIERFANTNAGAMPSTIERVAAYTPLVTTNFDGNLDETVNNLQALADAVDELPITPSVPIDAPTATNDFLLGEQVAGVWTWVRKTLAQAVTVLRGSLDSIYEPKNTNIQAHISASAPHAGHALALTTNNVTVTTSNVSAIENSIYNLTIAGLTANRNFILPAPSAAGKRITVNLLDGDDTYFMILIGDTGVTINGGSAATEFHRIQTKARSITFESTSTTNWQAVAGADEFVIAMGMYNTVLNPLTATNNVHVFAIPGPMKLTSWAAAYYNYAPCDGTNYWTINLYNGATSLANFNTSVQAAWTLVKTTSFSDPNILASVVEIDTNASKNAAAGNLFFYSTLKGLLC